MKRFLSVLLALVMVMGLFPMGILCASAEEITATLSFASTANRTSYSTSQQVWEQNGITFTNDKASSSTNVGNYSNPVRLYAKSSATIAYNGGNITKIEVTCSSSSYATVFKNSAGDEATASDSVVTIVPTASAASYTITSFTAQTRISSITVYAESAESGTPETETTAPTETTVPEETTVPSTDTEGTWVLVTDASTLAAGDQIIIAAVAYDYAISTTQNSNNRGRASITKGDNTIAEPGSDVQILTLEAGTTDGTFAFNTGSGYLYAASSSSNYLRTETSKSANSSWEITISADGTATVVAQGTNTRNTMQYNTGGLFACYGSASQKAICLYKRAASASTDCSHDNKETITVDPTCTDAGSTTITCSDCGEILETTTIAALGHDYASVVTAPTCTVDGYTTHTCQREGCGNSYTDSIVAATGHTYVDHVCSVCSAVETTYTVSFSVPEGITGVASMTCGGNGITLPTAGAPEGYSFVGWTTEETSETTAAPTVLTGTYNATQDITLYALYSYTTGSGSSEYVLTDISQIGASDTVVITMTVGDATYAMSNDNGSTIPDAIEVSVSNDQLVADPASNLTWNVVSTTNGYIIYPAGQTSTWLYCIADNKGLRVGSEDENNYNVFTLDAESGYLMNVGRSRYLGVYKEADWRSYTSVNANISGQTLGFYVKGNSATYYTTAPETIEVCAHENTSTTTVDATCTADGAITVTCDDCNATISKTNIPAPGHDYASVVTAPTCTEGGYTTYTCTVCGDSYTGDETAATGHSFDGDTCTVCGSTKQIFELVTDASTLAVDDQIVIVAAESDYAMSTTQNSKNRGQAAVTKDSTNDTVTFGSDVQILTLEAGTTDGTFAFNTGSGYLYAASSSANQLKTQTVLTDSGSWNITITDGVASVIASDTSVNNVMQYNKSSSMFSCYNDASLQAISIYRLADGPVACKHPNTTLVGAKDATCTENGYTGDTVCVDCEETVTEGTVIDALGHSYNTVVTEPKCSTDGYTTYTCSTCGHSYTDDIVAATGHSFVDGICTNCGVLLPLDPETGSDTVFVKVTTDLIDWSGEYLIVYEFDSDVGYVFNSQNPLDENDNLISVTIQDHTINNSEADVRKVVIEKMEGGYSIKAANGMYIGNKGTANDLEISETPMLNTISLDEDGNIVINGQDGTYLRYNHVVNAKGRFRYYSPDTYNNLLPIVLYKQMEAAVCEGGQILATYETVEAAYAACEDGQYVKLLTNADAVLSLDKDLYIDMNSFDLSGTVTANGYTVYGMDNTTNLYTCENIGYFSCTDESGNAVEPVAHFKTVYSMTGAIRRYLAINEAGKGWSFHRFYLGITHVTLRPGATGIGYKAIFGGDEMVKACLATDQQSFGFVMSIKDGESHSYSLDADSFITGPTGKTASLLLQNIDVENFGETPINASAFMILNGEKIESATYSYTFRRVVEDVNKDPNLSSYTEAQKNGLIALYETWGQTMETFGWSVSNIAALVPSEAE